MKIHHLLLFVLLMSVSACMKSVVTSGLPKLEEGMPTGTVYVGYGEKMLPSGARMVLFDNSDIFAINAGEYTKFKVTPGSYKLRVECVREGGWSDVDSNQNTLFNISEDDELHFMIRADQNCKKPLKGDIKLVSGTELQNVLLAFKYLDFRQFYVEKGTLAAQKKLAAAEALVESAPAADAALSARAAPPAKTVRSIPVAPPPVNDDFKKKLAGEYHRQKPLKGMATVELHGNDVVIQGRDLLWKSPETILAGAHKPYKPGPEIKIVAKLIGINIVGEWWYVSDPKKKRPFKAAVKSQFGRLDKVIYIEGDLAGALYKVDPEKVDQEEE